MPSKFSPPSQHISEVWVLFIGKILKRKLSTLLLIRIDRHFLSVLHSQEEIQRHRRGDRYAITVFKSAMLSHVAQASSFHTPYDQSRPQLRIVLRLGLRSDQLWPDNVSNAVGHEDGRRHERLLGVTRDVGHADGDDQADDAAKAADDGVASNRSPGAVRPLALPDHSTAGNDWEAAYDEHYETDVWEPRPQISSQEDDEDADAAQRKLPQDGIESAPTESRYDQWSEAAYGAIYCISGPSQLNFFSNVTFGKLTQRPS
jgi:hypothetical protein